MIATTFGRRSSKPEDHLDTVAEASVRAGEAEEFGGLADIRAAVAVEVVAAETRARAAVRQT